MISTKDSKPQLPAKVEPNQIRIVMICEAYPENMQDYFYASSDSLYVANTVGAFQSAGVNVANVDDILSKGVYLTVAVKEVRKGLVVPSSIIEKYSHELEEELNLFPNAKVILLMGDAAIKAINYISRRKFKARAIPPGSTYKIRNKKYYFGKVRVFPSYLPTGRNFLIEKAKQKMVAEDIRNAFRLI